MDSLTKLAAFNEIPPAEAVIARLKESGIEAFLHDESTQQKWQLWNLKPRAHLHVRVGIDQEAHAGSLLRQWAAEAGSSLGAVRCPDCGSFAIEYPQFSRKTLLGAVPAALATAGLIEQAYYCDACHLTWPGVPPEKEPDLDILNWPKRDT